MSDLISRQVLDLWNRYRPTIAVDAIEYDRELKKLLGTNLAEVGTEAISREQAIDAIGEKSDEIYKTKQKGATYPHDDFFQGMAYAENVVKQLPPIQPESSEECERCMMEHMDAMEELETKLALSEPHWIPVTEDTLPERNRVVVVCGEKGTWDFGTYRGHGNDIHYWNWKKNTYKRVYWWMYKEDALPEPYKGVTT